jgi:hypothetical protein
MESDFEKGAVQRNLTYPFTPATANGPGFLRPSANSPARLPALPADHWNAPVYAHPLEHPYLTGQKEA